jgi:D-alanine-D-alanine ligase
LEVESVEELDFLELSWPLIVKPAREDASLGIDFDSVVRNLDEAKLAVSRILNRLLQPAILEQFIEGREIYVSLLGNQPCRALPLSEIQFGAAFSNKPKIVSYNAKWETDSPECVDSPSVSCVLDDALKTVLVDAAKRAFNALGARDYGRVDFRLSSEGQPFVIDINPNCDLHPDAGFSKAAKSAGMSYEDLALFLVQIALERHHAHSPPDTSRQRRTGQPTFTHRDVHSGGSAMRAGARRPRTHAKSS